ncbi:MAG: tape measure protein [Allorhizobium sp.]
MANDQQLVVQLEARIRDFERNLIRANKVANDNFGSIERRGRPAGKNLETSFANSTANISRGLGTFGAGAAAKLSGAFAAIAAGVSLNELRKTADEYTKIMNTLKVAGVKDGDLPGTFDKLFASAQRNAVPLDALASLYGRVSQAQTTLKASSQDVMRVTDIVAQSLRISGKSASESSGALLQLAQAFSNGKVQAEEFNSLLDGAYPLLQAAAAGLKEAGGDVAKLTALVKDGKVSSEAFFRAIEAGAPLLEEKLAGAVLTSEQAMQRLQNEFIKAVGEFDKATGASAALAGAIDGLAGSISGIGSAAAGAVNGVQALIGKVGELAAANAGVQRQQALIYQNERAGRTDAAREMALGNSGGRDKLAQERAAAGSARSRSERTAYRQTEIDFANRLREAPTPPARPTGLNGNPIKPVSLADYKVPGEKASGGGGGGGSGAEKQGRYDKDIESVQRRTEELRLEAEMVGKGKLEVEKSKIALQLEQAAKRDGVTLSEDVRTAIDAAATGYANAKVRVEDLKSALDGARDAQKFFATEITDGLTDMILEGKSATEVVQGLGKALLKAALQAALMGSGPLAGLFGSKGTDGAVGGLFGMLVGGLKLADGGPVSGPGTGRSDSIPAMLSDGEYVVNARATMKNRDLLNAINSGRLPKFADGGLVGSAPMIPAMGPLGNVANSNAVSQSVIVNVNSKGGDPKQNADLAAQIGKVIDQQLKGMIGSQIRAAIRPGGMLTEAGR